MTKEYLKELAKEYIERYPERLSKFLNEFEANEMDFVEREIEYFHSTLVDLENSEASHDGYSITGWDNFNLAYIVSSEIGFDRFRYSTLKKINFLTEKRTIMQLPEHEMNIEKQPTESIEIAVFKLSNKRGAKIDLIRVLNALYELRFFTKIDGQLPNKQEFMETMGKCFSVDLSKYHSNLSQALQNQPLEVNLNIFEEMKEVIQNAHYQTKTK